MARDSERARGVTLRVLDFTPLIADVPLTDDDRAKETTPAPAFAPYAVAERDGHVWVVCNEGVGWDVTEDEPLTVDLYPQRPGHIAILPKWQAGLGPDEVRELATGEEIDLADLVRRFGGRLESNFWTWHRKLAAKES
jgi:hypothetical protein